MKHEAFSNRSEQELSAIYAQTQAHAVFMVVWLILSFCAVESDLSINNSYIEAVFSRTLVNLKNHHNWEAGKSVFFIIYSLAIGTIFGAIEIILIMRNGVVEKPSLVYAGAGVVCIFVSADLFFVDLIAAEDKNAYAISVMISLALASVGSCLGASFCTRVRR